MQGLNYTLRNKVPVFDGDGNVRDGYCLLMTASVHGMIGTHMRILQSYAGQLDQYDRSAEEVSVVGQL